MRTSKEEVMAEFAQVVFLAAGGVLLFLSGYVCDLNTLLSSIFLFIGTICIVIRIEYSKEDGE